MKNYYRLHDLYYQGAIPKSLKTKANIMMILENISAAYALIVLWILESVITINFWVKIIVFILLCVIFTYLMDILTGLFIKHYDVY